MITVLFSTTNIGVFLFYQHDVIQNRLNDLFNSLAIERQISQSDIKTQQSQAAAAGAPLQKPIYETNFPELFYY